MGEDNLKTYITEYYKKLCGAPRPTNISMIEELNHDIPQLSAEENSILTDPFTVKEIYEAISQMEHNKAPGPDGFPAEFYQTFWEVIKGDLMALFNQLKSCELLFFNWTLG